jgi:mannose-6-phosphate isomerase-like protein (cupin superfamily)
MRTILYFIFAAWIVMPTVSCAQVGNDSTSPGQLAPDVSQKTVLEASLGTTPPVGWKWQVQERTRARAGDAVVRHTNSALYYTLEETHELVRGDTVETFPRGQAVFVPAGLEHIHRMLPVGSALRTFEIYFAPGDGSRPSPAAGVRSLYFSEHAMEVVPGVTYTIRVVEVTLLPGARRDLTPRERQINYVLEGVMTRRLGDQVLRYEPSSVLELPLSGTPFTASNESAMPMRFLVVDLLPVPASASAPAR